MKRKLIAVLLLGACASLPVRAADSDEVDRLLPLSLAELLDMNVSISTNSQKRLSKAPSVVSVITAEDIKATGASNVSEILQTVPGLYIRHNQFAFRPLVSMRGSTAYQTLVMVNGSPMRDLMWSTGIFWKGVPAGMVERIEIIRGPGSALYGSDASAGAINIITKTAGKIRGTEVGVRAGSFDSQTAWLQHGAAWNGFDINLTAEFSHTDGHRPLIPVDRQYRETPALSAAPGRADYGYDNQDVRLSIANGPWRMMADYMRHSNLGIGLTGGSILDSRTSAGDGFTGLALLYGNENFAKDWGLNAEIRYRDLDYTSGSGFYERPMGYTCTGCSPSIANGLYPDGFINRMRSAERRLNYEVSGRYSGFRNHVLGMGFGQVWQDLYFVKHAVNYGLGPTGALLPAGGPLVDVSDTDSAFVPERMRKNAYLFVQDVWNFAEGWELTAGLRHDRYSGFSGSTTPRLALVWQTSDRLTSKFMYGKGFRVPSYLELYAKTAATQANGALDPEETHTTELAFSYLVTQDLKFGVNLFEYVQLNPIIDAGQYQNAERHVIRGYEAEIHWQPLQTLRLSGNLTQRRQPFLANPIYYTVPNEEAYLRVDWNFQPKWHWNLQANWTGKRAKSPTDTRPALGSQTVADTTLRYEHDRQWEFAASIRNVFDADLREYTGTSVTYYLPLLQRNFFLEARYKF